jgi:hypothetical protein
LYSKAKRGGLFWYRVVKKTDSNVIDMRDTTTGKLGDDWYIE